jgi:replication-associated recombination protein RarA
MMMTKAKKAISNVGPRSSSSTDPLPGSSSSSGSSGGSGSDDASLASCVVDLSTFQPVLAKAMAAYTAQQQKLQQQQQQQQQQPPQQQKYANKGLRRITYEKDFELPLTDSSGGVCGTIIGQVSLRWGRPQ